MLRQDFNTLTEREQKLLRVTYNRMGILDRWHDKKWEDFTNDDRALKIIKGFCDKSKEAMKDGAAPYLFGANGVGKTLLMNILLMELFSKGHSVQVISVSTLISRFTGGWYDKDERKSLMQMLQKTDFLAIEEFGKLIGNSVDLHCNVLEPIIRFRVQMKRPTIYTSNKAPSEIRTTYNEDIASMLKEANFDLQVKGLDMRDLEAEKLKEKYK